MSITLSEIYKSKAFVLARTSVIRLHAVALMINKDLVEQGYQIDELNPSTWKYYMNLNGQYHQADHDKLRKLSGGKHDHIRIKVAGDDKPVEVNFTKELLYGDGADLAVANEYRFNTQYYNSLVTRYPDFEYLILGVLNPISIPVAVNAQEGEILYCGGYSKSILPSGLPHMVRQDYGPISENFLIEVNEENMIPILQEYIYGFLRRYSNPGYIATHNLFLLTLIKDVHLFMAMWIFNIRLGNIKSPLGFTHSFHIRNYLESKGGLGWVIDYIDKREALWLYRNLEWLYANQGKDMVFKAIIDNILTPSNVPIHGYLLRHDLENIGVDGELYAKAYMEKDVINFSHTGTGQSYEEVIDIIEKEEPLAVENYYANETRSVKVANSSIYSMFDKVNTKVLESVVIDLSNQLPHTLEDIALNLWLFTASYGFYKGTVLVTHPVTNDRIQLTPINAYILALYCFNKGYSDYDLGTIPDMRARLIPRIEGWKPNPEALDKATLEDMKYGTLETNITEKKIKDIMGDFVPVFKQTSALSISKEIQRQHTEIMRRYYEYCKIEDMDGRAMGEWVSYHQYWMFVPCKLVQTKTNYSDWLLNQGIDLEGFSRADYVDLGMKIVEAATGLDTLRTDKLRNTQTAALSILRHFMSYTTQIIQGIVSSDAFLIGNKTLRIGNDKAKGKSEVWLPVTRIISDLSVKLKEGPIDLERLTEVNINKVKEEIKISFPVEMSLELSEGSHAAVINVPMFTTCIYDADIPDIDLSNACAIITEDEKPIVTEYDRETIIEEQCGLKLVGVDEAMHSSSMIRGLKINPIN